jgi:predicted  nucleic acid-binding Zn-ribbon protein
MAQRDRGTTQTDKVRELIEAITAEKEKIEDALEAIRVYADRLRAAVADAQQRLIGRE